MANEHEPIGQILTPSPVGTQGPWGSVWASASCFALDVRFAQLNGWMNLKPPAETDTNDD